MLNLTAKVNRFDSDYVYLSELREYGRPIEVDCHRMYCGTLEQAHQAVKEVLSRS